MGFTWDPAKLTATMKRRAIERFWGKVKKADAGCWIWTGIRDKDGYGRHRPGTGKQYMRAHRFSWMIHGGKIPHGLFVLHRCDNPPCVNPIHLFLGTHLDNVRDQQAKGRTLCGEKHWRKQDPLRRGAFGERVGTSKLKEWQVAEILQNGSMGLTALSRKYGVTKAVIQSIRKRKTWKHVQVSPIPHPEEPRG